jgi:cysteine synthase A
MINWVSQAVLKLEADFQRSSDTHLIKIPLPAVTDIHLYVKDESTHPTGSLKHRLARSLFLYGLCNGLINEGTHIVEASSGSTAISEAYFAQLLGLPFTAVVPEGTSQKKIDQIAFYNGNCHFVKASDIYKESERLTKECDGHYMDQFTYAERATDWRGNNNIAESIFSQMKLEPYPIPSAIVVSAGTGGTSATIGRFIRYKGFDTEMCVADPSHSVFYDFFRTKDKTLTLDVSSRIEGIGRPRVESSFVSSVIDTMVKVPDEAAFATLHFLSEILNRRCGGSTGTNLYAAFLKIHEMHVKGVKGSVVSIICDSGERYADTYYNNDWLSHNGYLLKMKPYAAELTNFYKTGMMNVVN